MNGRLPALGKTVMLRRLVPEDVNEKYVAWLNDPDVNRYLETRYLRQTIDMVRAYVESKLSDPSEHLLAICDAVSGEHVGNIKIGPINRHHMSADVSLFIGEARMRGRGAGTEAVALASAHAFRALSLNKLRAGMYAENTASIRAFEHCGWEREGVLKRALLLDGREVDHVLMGIHRSDFLARETSK